MTDGQQNIPDNVQSNKQGFKPQQITFTPEENELIQRERMKHFWYRQMPAFAGTAYGVYYLQVKGIIKKSKSVNPFWSYFPKSFGFGFLAHTIVGLFGVASLGKKLEAMDGNFSRVKRGEPQLPVDGDRPSSYTPASPTSPTSPNVDVTSPVVDDRKIADSVFNPKAPEESLPPKRALTYEDLRRRNRLQEDIAQGQQTKQGQGQDNKMPSLPEYPNTPPPPTPSGPGSKNKYGDSWS